MPTDRFYALLTERTGISRTVDSRLEFAARLRAQEAVQQVGYDSGEIEHPPQSERQARLDWSNLYGVAELATWNYLWRDPVQAAVDGLMNSTAHREVLLNQRGTFPFWGAGIYRTFKPGDEQTALNERWYFLIWLATGVPAVKAIVYNGTASTDGLNASYLSAKYAAPLFPVNKSSIPPIIRDRIAALEPTEILVVGGTDVVDASVATALTTIAPVKRLAGADRYATAVEVSKG